MPQLVAAVDPDVSWLPSSPHFPTDMLLPFDDRNTGDLHEWNVWGNVASPHEYEQTRYPRFASEFGNESLSSAELVRAFCPPDQLDLKSPTLVLRQKSGGKKANAPLVEYLNRSFRPAKDFDSLVYQTQAIQAWSNAIGTRLWRRQAPHCMGSLIWQLNDTWPGTTWSITNFGGQWKPAMYQAKRDYAPALVMAYIPVEDRKANYWWKGDRRPVRLTTVYDGAADLPVTLRWSACRVADGTAVQRGTADLTLHPGRPATAADLDLTDACRANGDRKLYLRYAIESGGRTLSEDTFWFAEPKDVDLPHAAVRTTVAQAGPRTFRVTFASPVVQSRYFFDLAGQSFRATDNAFDLYPGEPRMVEVTTAADLSPADVQRNLRGRSVADTYDAR